MPTSLTVPEPERRAVRRTQVSETRLLDRRSFIASLVAAPLVVNLLSACELLGGAVLGESDTDLVQSGDARAPGTDPTFAAEKVTWLGEKLLAELAAETPTDNIVVSPLSIATTLAMALLGAVEMTEWEIATVLGAIPWITVEDGDPVDMFIDEFHPSMNALLTQLDRRSRTDDGPGDDPDTVALDVANALWAQSGYHWKERFLDRLAQQYGTGVHIAEFQADPERARHDINAWVADTTDDRIAGLIPTGTIDDLTRLLLINAAYFKANWQTRFDPAATSDDDFTTAAGDTVTVAMMHLTERLKAVRLSGWNAVELPYAFGELALVVAVPDAQIDDPDVEVPPLGDLVDQLADHAVTLGLPRFEIEHQASLADVLGRLGMSRAFSPEADFSAMTGDEPLRIGDVIGRATISVGEDGTEAAAATAVEVMAGAADPGELTPVRIIVDRPFTFWLRDIVTGAVLFTGRVNNPLA